MGIGDWGLGPIPMIGYHSIFIYEIEKLNYIIKTTEYN
jgi:hypothetical protein